MALITAAEARLLVPALTGTAEDTNLDTLIARADAVLAQWCGYEPATEGGAGVPTLEDTTYTRFMPGIGGRDLQLPFYPIVSVTSVEYDTTEAFNGTTYLVPSGSYDIRKDRGIVRLKQTSTPIAEWVISDQDYIKAIWVAGWATIPADMKHAVCELCSYWMQQRGTLGKQTFTIGSQTTTPKPDETIPLAVRQLMSPYRLLRAWV